MITSYFKKTRVEWLFLTFCLSLTSQHLPAQVVVIPEYKSVQYPVPPEPEGEDQPPDVSGEIRPLRLTASDVSWHDNLLPEFPFTLNQRATVWGVGQYGAAGPSRLRIPRTGL